MVLSVALLGQSTLAQAATDWAPYVRSMMSGCSFPNPVDEGLPPIYNKSVISKKVKVDPEDYDIVGYKGDSITTFNLKNATAFGYPLLKVEQLQGYEWQHLKLYFKDTEFTSLRPRFKLPLPEDQEYSSMFVKKNDASGYDVEELGYISLNFDTEDKSITCYMGL